ncbi:hypothetical protein A2U01_0074469, partial [Trifolium medium]|nr:hypothetical protein [Trifolium medium]
GGSRQREREGSSEREKYTAVTVSVCGGYGGKLLSRSSLYSVSIMFF